MAELAVSVNANERASSPSSISAVTPLEDADGVVESLFHYLQRKDERGQSCPLVYCPDTVLYKYRTAAYWFYMCGEQMEVHRKSDMHAEILEKVFATRSHEYDICAYHIGTSETVDGQEIISIEYFDVPMMKDFLLNKDRYSYNLLQKFILPSGTRNAMIRVIWSPNMFICERRVNTCSLRDRRVEMFDRAVTFEAANRYSEAAPMASKSLRTALHQICNSIHRHVLKTSSQHISRMVLNFKQDAAGRLWLLWCSSLRLSSPGSQPNERMMIPSPLSCDPLHASMSAVDLSYPAFAPIDLLRSTQNKTPLSKRNFLQAELLKLYHLCPQCKRTVSSRNLHEVTYLDLIQFHERPRPQPKPPKSTQPSRRQSASGLPSTNPSPPSLQPQPPLPLPPPLPMDSRPLDYISRSQHRPSETRSSVLRTSRSTSSIQIIAASSSAVMTKEAECPILHADLSPYMATAKYLRKGSVRASSAGHHKPRLKGGTTRKINGWHEEEEEEHVARVDVLQPSRDAGAVIQDLLRQVRGGGGISMEAIQELRTYNNGHHCNTCSSPIGCHCNDVLLLPDDTLLSSPVLPSGLKNASTRSLPSLPSPPPPYQSHPSPSKPPRPAKAPILPRVQQQQHQQKHPSIHTSPPLAPPMTIEPPPSNESDASSCLAMDQLLKETESFLSSGTFRTEEEYEEPTSTTTSTTAKPFFDTTTPLSSSCILTSQDSIEAFSEDSAMAGYVKKKKRAKGSMDSGDLHRRKSLGTGVISSSLSSSSPGQHPNLTEKDGIIPPSIRLLHPHVSLEEYALLAANQDFLSTRVYICDDCFLNLADSFMLAITEKVPSRPTNPNANTKAPAGTTSALSSPPHTPSTPNCGDAIPPSPSPTLSESRPRTPSSPLSSNNPPTGSPKSKSINRNTKMTTDAVAQILFDSPFSNLIHSHVLAQYEASRIFPKKTQAG